MKNAGNLVLFGPEALKYLSGPNKQVISVQPRQEEDHKGSDYD